MNRKLLILVSCLVTALLLGIAPMAAQDIPGITIADIITTAARSPEPEFTILSRMLFESDTSVLAALDNPNNLLTFFAPTDAAFRELRSSRFGAAAFDTFVKDSSMVSQMMMYHIVTGSYATSDLEDQIAAGGINGLNLSTFLGQYLHFTAAADSKDYIIDGEARPIVEGVAITLVGENQSLTITGPDIQAVNGTIHVIDHVLAPTVNSVVQVLIDNNFAPTDTFNSFLSAVAIAEPSVTDLLTDPDSDVTVLVPTDAAFEVFKTPVDTMLENMEATSDFVAYHILPGRFSSYELRARIADSSDGMAIINTALGGTFSRTTVAFTLNEDDDLVANGGARLIRQDVDAGRSLIHVIDAVLEPPA